MRSFCSWESMGRNPSRERVEFIPCNPLCVMAEHRRPKDGVASRVKPAHDELKSAELLLPIRPRIARLPAAGLDAGDEVGDRLVEQRRLLLVHHVTCPWHHHEA